MSDNNLPEHIRDKVSNLTGFQRKYCEFRSKGFSQGLAARKAGSQGTDANQYKIGHAVEQIPGVKDYIQYLQDVRAKITGVDEVEVIAKIREVFEAAMKAEGTQLKTALGAAELLGESIGLFGKPATSRNKGVGGKTEEVPDSGTEAFREGAEDDPTMDRINRLQQMMKDLNKGTGSSEK
jgi:hypothetical protein